MLNKLLTPLLFALLATALPAISQVSTNTSALNASSKVLKSKEANELKTLLSTAKEKKWKMTIRTKQGLATLVGIDAFGYPLYVSTSNATDAASSIGTNQLWSGGSLGLSLSGSSNSVKGKMGIWDGGKIRLTHVELRNRVTQKDNSQTLEDHSTHVAGILMGAGINSLAKGMAFGLQNLLAYDYNGHVSEMTEEANTLIISNHSYTSVAGWNYNETDKRWEFWGKSGENEDYKFGYYSDEARDWDKIAYNAPFYLIVKAVGNNRSQVGPEIGQPYFRYNTSGSMADGGTRPAGISSNNGYDIIPTYGTSKNILTVGAIQPFASIYSQPSDVVLTGFSNWGPTDDGRIKPDLVANGVNILSSTASSDNSYGSMSGTSMASPSVAGSALLLQEYYQQLHGRFMRSATLKGILIHTANEAGVTAGPDYQFGWGVANIEKAAEVIQSGNTDHFIYENELNTTTKTFSVSVEASGNGPLVATICWTDPEGTVQDPPVLNSRTPKLVNDLDIRIKNGANTYMPWVLNPNVPAAAATQNDNVLDNVEKIEIPNAVQGQIYTIEISHKGTLTNNTQAYSLIVSKNYKESFDKKAIDLSIAGIYSPEVNACPGSQLVSVNIKNSGTVAQTTIPVTTIIKNGNTTITTLTGIYKATIEAGKQVSYTYSTPFVAQAGTTYTFESVVNFTGDQNSLNNQQTSSITTGNGSAGPGSLSAQFCQGKVRLRAIDNAGGPIFWYDSPNATAPIAAGYDTSTTTIPSNNTYYAALNDVSLKAGLPNKSITSTGVYAALSNNIIKMTAAAPLTIESARLYVGNPGKVKFTIGKVVDPTHYLPVASTIIDVYATDPTPQPGSSNNSGNYEPGDVGAVFKLNLPLPEAGDYFFIIECQDGATLFYNNGINTNPYPVTLPNVLSITGHNATDTNNPGNVDFYKRFYMAVYDIGIKFFGCASARVPVIATVCDEEAAFDVIVRSNPSATGSFGLQFDVIDKADLNISIYNTSGQRVYNQQFPGFEGSFFRDINPGILTRGVYILRIEHGGNKISKKLVVLK